MKRILSILVLALAFSSAFAQEQNPQMVQFLKAFPQRAGFNTHSYEFTDVVDTPAPHGYKPFYISHYGRHGSRSDWAGNYTYKLVRDILAQAKADGVALTPAGDSLLWESAYVLEKYDGMDGRLTPRGVREHRMLAQRMYKRFPEVFQKGSIDSLDHETLSTIQCFFDNNLNVSETSRKMFVHRNTLVYRLDKIKKITGLDLREFDNAITFKVALMVRRYLASKKNRY